MNKIDIEDFDDHLHDRMLRGFPGELSQDINVNRAQDHLTKLPVAKLARARDICVSEDFQIPPFFLGCFEEILLFVFFDQFSLTFCMILMM